MVASLVFWFEVSLMAFLGAHPRTVSAQSITALALNLPQGAGPMFWDGTRSRFFASSGTSVLMVNPESAQVEDTIAVGSQTGQLAVSDDGQYLYVVAGGSSYDAPYTINRYKVQGHSLDLQIPVGLYPGVNGPLGVTAMVVPPGQPSSLVVALSDSMVTVFDNAVARPSSLSAGLTSLYVRTGDDAIFGFGDGPEGFGAPRIWRLAVSKSGVSVAQSVPVNPNWDNGTVTWNGNLVTNRGPLNSFVFDLNAGATIGSLPLPQTTGASGVCVLAPDSSGTSVIVYQYDYESDGSAVSLVRYSTANLQPTASSPLTGLPPDGGSLSNVCNAPAATWGTDGIMIGDRERQIFFLHASGLAPMTPAAIPNPSIDASGVIHLALAANGLAYDSVRNVVWASIAGSAGAAGNSVVSIDPATGAVVDTIYAGSEPGALALSADGSHLFAVLGGSPAIVVVDLAAKKSSSFPISAGSSSRYWYGQAVASIAGTSNSVVAVTTSPTAAQSAGGSSVIAYDAGVARPNTFNNGVGADLYANYVQTIFPADSSNAYYAANATMHYADSTHDVFRLIVDSSGVRLDRKLNNLLLGSGAGASGTTAANQPVSMVYDSGRLFTSAGQILTPDGSHVLGSAALDPGYGIPVPFSDQNAVAFVQSYAPELSANFYDLGTFRPTASIGLLKGPFCGDCRGGLSPVNVTAAVRAGNSIAAAANGEIVIAPSSSLQPWSVPSGSVSTVSPGVQRVDIPVNAISVLPGTSKLLLATPSTAGSMGNSIVTYNPATLQVENTAYLGSEPSILSPTPDGSAVYAYLSGEYDIGRMNIASGVRDLLFTPDPMGGSNQYSVFDMAASPDGGVAASYQGVVAIQGSFDAFGIVGAIAKFDNGIARPKADFNTQGSDAGDLAKFELAFNDAGTTLYAYNVFLSQDELKRESVSPQGVQWLSTTPGLINGTTSAIRYAQGLLYTTFGDVIDPEGFVIAGRFVDPWLNQGLGIEVAPDRGGGRVYFLTNSGILIFDINSHALLARFPIATIFADTEYGVSLVRFGSDGLAFHTSAGHLYLVSIASIPLLQTPVPSPQPASIAVNGIVPIFSSVPVIQPGSWVSIFGANLAATTASWNNDFPTSLAGVTVTIDNRPAYLEFVSPGVINVQAPDDTATGLVGVAVTTPNGTAQEKVTLAAFAPSLSLFDSTHVAAEILTPDGSGDYGGGSYDLVGPLGQFSFQTRPVKAGETLALYGVGLGPTHPSVPAGGPFSGAAPTVNPVTVTIGGISAQVQFAGVVAAGVYQINVVVPAAPSGDQPVQLAVGGSKAPLALVTLQ
jgi:uncharacterized protein (TIGR03437 family)